MTEFKTREEIFEKAWNGLNSQGFRRAVDNRDSSCKYLTEDGLRCAIGWCMSAEDLVEQPIGIVGDSEINRLAGIKGEDVPFARGLQRIHDNTPDPDKMKERFIGYAYAHGLEYLI